MKSDFTYNDRLSDGLHKEYYKNFQLNSEGRFKDVIRNGVWVLYFDNSQLKLHQLYKNQKIGGLSMQSIEMNEIK